MSTQVPPSPKFTRTVRENEIELLTSSRTPRPIRVDCIPVATINLMPRK